VASGKADMVALARDASTTALGWNAARRTRRQVRGPPHMALATLDAETRCSAPPPSGRGRRPGNRWRQEQVEARTIESNIA